MKNKPTALLPDMSYVAAVYHMAFRVNPPLGVIEQLEHDMQIVLPSMPVDDHPFFHLHEIIKTEFTERLMKAESQLLEAFYLKKLKAWDEKGEEIEV
jgi:hypothetical protein